MVCGVVWLHSAHLHHDPFLSGYVHRIMSYSPALSDAQFIVATVGTLN